MMMIPMKQSALWWLFGILSLSGICSSAPFDIETIASGGRRHLLSLQSDHGHHQNSIGIVNNKGDGVVEIPLRSALIDAVSHQQQQQQQRQQNLRGKQQQQPAASSPLAQVHDLKAAADNSTSLVVKDTTTTTNNNNNNKLGVSAKQNDLTDHVIIVSGGRMNLYGKQRRNLQISFPSGLVPAGSTIEEAAEASEFPSDSPSVAPSEQECYSIDLNFETDGDAGALSFVIYNLEDLADGVLNETIIGE